MSNIERFENLVLGSGGAGKFIAWTMSDAGRCTAMVDAERSVEPALMSPVFRARTSSTPPTSSRSPGEERNLVSGPSRSGSI
jgi:choline dehydrogenase-like flavoprotein